MQLLNIRISVLSILLVLVFPQVIAQPSYKFTGTLTDEYNHPLVGATVQLLNTNIGASTDRKGIFVCKGLEKKKYIFQYSFLGYRTVIDTIQIDSDKNRTVKLFPENNLLGEITVTENARNLHRADNTLSLVVVDDTFLQENAAGSLMQTLSRLPGVSSMDIGAGQSKPVIRGLGFNRVAVSENGIKHEAQEWGADHGLEIDQFTVERVEVVKGPASLMYGANAIGGVINLKQIISPEQNSAGGSVLLNSQTNNDLFGASAKFFKRHQHFYYKLHATYTDYSDYRIPTDSITYMTYNIDLKNNHLRNTAGGERNGSVTVGYLNNGFSTHLSVTDNFTKSGFFANAHGLEIRNSQIDYDASSRDIDLPSQQVNHFKVLSNTIWFITDYKLNVDLGFQNNYRQEFSEKVAHGYMPVPPDSLERLYNKDTWTVNLKLELPKHSRHQFAVGTSTDYQKNNSGGWGFMLPAYRALNVGTYVYDNFQLSYGWMMHAGLRYDFGLLQTDSYYDWYKTPQAIGEDSYLQHASALKRNFGNISWGIGIHRQTDNAIYKVNLGKSFRMPTAKEIASNGINYHMYRYEKGDSTLQAEESYQLDLGVELKNKSVLVEFSPFVNYFPNYIYLNPTASYYEAQQVYFYSQSSVFRTGGEMVITYNFNKRLMAKIDAEYIYSLQLTGSKKGYTLPFSPPFNSNIELTYKPKTNGYFKHPEFGTIVKLTAAQNEIVPPEKKTSGYLLLSFNAGTEFKVGRQSFRLNMKLNNAFNTRYYDHTSFYRLIEVPGQGRNLISTLHISI